MKKYKFDDLFDIKSFQKGFYTIKKEIESINDIVTYDKRLEKILQINAQQIKRLREVLIQITCEHDFKHFEKGCLVFDECIKCKYTTNFKSC